MGISSLRSEGLIDREIAALLIEVFRPRTELFAWRVDDPETAARLNRWEATHRGARARTWTVGDWRPAGPRGQRCPVTSDDIALHLSGARTLGFYPMQPDGSCNSVSADFDSHRGATLLASDPAVDFEALVERLRHDRIPHLAHRSRGGGGYWVHLLVPRGTTARDARTVMHGLLREAGVRSVADGGSFDGLFPKQDLPSAPPPDDPTSRPGNLFCLPMSRRWLANTPPGSGFVGVDPDDFAAQVFHLWKARRVENSVWKELVTRFAPSLSPRVSAPRPAPAVRAPTLPPMPWSSEHSTWELALRRAGRLGRPLGDGRHALLCINDGAHSAPEGSVDNARGSCVLFPPSERSPHGFPWCAHAHCARLSPADWIRAIGQDVWDDASLSSRGMRRAGPFLLCPAGVTTWYRDPSGAITPSRRDTLCEVPLWIAEDQRTERGTVRVVEAVVGARTRRVRVSASKFAELAWLSRVGVDVKAILAPARARLVEALERLSDPVPLRAMVQVEPVDQVAVQSRADDLVSLLRVMLDASNSTCASDRARPSRARRSA